MKDQEKFLENPLEAIRKAMQDIWNSATMPPYTKIQHLILKCQPHIALTKNNQ